MAEYTRESYDALLKALDDAKSKHAEAQRQIGISTAGDTNVWHDNFAFEEANRQELLHRTRVARLTAHVAEAVVVERDADNDTIQVGSHVTVHIQDEDDEETFVIGGEQNELRQSADGYIMLSQKSPLGMALMGKSLEDRYLQYTLPNGTTQEVEIIKAW